MTNIKETKQGGMHMLFCKYYQPIERDELYGRMKENCGTCKRYVGRCLDEKWLLNPLITEGGCVE